MQKKNFQLTLSYDGTDFFGWQKTQSGLSVEECLNHACKTFLKEEIFLQAASRTDRGVHAKHQVVSFFSSTEIDLSLLLRKLNALLPKSIHIRTIETVASSFHPSVSALSKEYRYFACNQAIQHPKHRHFSWHIYTPLDWNAMKKAADLLTGVHDFSALSNEKQQNTIREIQRIEIEPFGENRLFFSIQGDRFLYKMARNIVGLLVYSGLKKIDPLTIPSILESRKRANAPMTAPAHGLFLWNVHYPERITCD